MFSTEIRYISKIIFDSFLEDVDFTSKSYANRCIDRVKIDHDPSGNGAFKFHPEYYAGSYKLNRKTQVNGNAFYESTWNKGKYGIWHCSSGEWTIGLSKDKNKKCTNIRNVAKSKKSSSYKCPDDIKNNWEYYNKCAKWWYPVGQIFIQVLPKDERFDM